MNREQLEIEYANWRELTEEALKDGPGSVDCGEPSVREDFSESLGLRETISFELMFELEQDYEKKKIRETFEDQISQNVFKKVSAMSFEKGKEYIKSLFPNVITSENYDGGRYDYDFIFDDDNELFISFTTSYNDNGEYIIVNFDKGYWNIQGQQYKAI